MNRIVLVFAARYSHQTIYRLKSRNSEATGEQEILKVKCPECDAQFDAPKDVIKGEVLSCPDCGLELEVSTVESQNVTVKKLQVSGEDWGE